MSEMIMRVAKAIHDSHPGSTGRWEYCLEDAYAAIQAMREPTDAMIDAGWSLGGTPDDIWPAMIDAALT